MTKGRDVNGIATWVSGGRSWTAFLCCIFCAILVHLSPSVAQTTQEVSVCSFTGATNINSLSSFDEWACTSGGVPLTDPCTPAAWTGIVCSSGGGDIISIQITSKNLEGMYDSFVNITD